MVHHLAVTLTLMQAPLLPYVQDPFLDSKSHPIMIRQNYTLQVLDDPMSPLSHPETRGKDYMFFALLEGGALSKPPIMPLAFTLRNYTSDQPQCLTHATTMLE